MSQEVINALRLVNDATSQLQVDRKTHSAISNALTILHDFVQAHMKPTVVDEPTPAPAPEPKPAAKKS